MEGRADRPNRRAGDLDLPQALLPPEETLRDPGGRNIAV